MGMHDVTLESLYIPYIIPLEPILSVFFSTIPK